MATFLLDANPSPRVARYLASRFNLDVTSLQGQRLGDLPDHLVIGLARRQGRVIIALDRDDGDDVLDAPRRDMGIIHLDLPTRLRTVPSINQFLAATIDLDHALTTIRADGLGIQHP